MNKPLLVLGLMSGTSADGIDVALARISGSPPRLRSRLLHHTTLPYPAAVRAAILCIASGAPVTTGEISQLHFLLGELFAEAALTALKRWHISPRRVSLIGSHGQTVFHQGAPAKFLGKKVSSTLQLAHPAVIATRTGITTIADFRPADMAAGGQGAPLVPFVDYLLFRHPRRTRVALNIGGIANLTVIPAAATPKQILAFDTGPGNMLLDALTHHYTRGKQSFDHNARIARRGKILPALLQQLLRNPYFSLRPPKSAGREQFGPAFVARILAWQRKHRARDEDILRTLTSFTALTITDALRFATQIAPSKRKRSRGAFPIHDVILSGGGAHNPLLFDELSSALSALSQNEREMSFRGPTVSVGPRNLLLQSAKNTLALRPSGRRANSASPRLFLSSDFSPSLPVDAKEAFAFALLAYETCHRRSANLPSATGAHSPAILGTISYAPPR